MKQKNKAVVAPADIKLNYFVPERMCKVKPFLGFSRKGSISVSNGLLSLMAMRGIEAISIANDNKGNWYVCKSKNDGLSFFVRRNLTSKKPSGVFNSLSLKYHICVSLGISENSKFKMFVDPVPMTLNGVEFFKLIPPDPKAIK